MKFVFLVAGLLAVNSFAAVWGAESPADRATKLLAGYDEFLVKNYKGYLVSKTDWSSDTKRKSKSVTGILVKSDGVTLARSIVPNEKTGATISGTILTSAGRSFFYDSKHAIIEHAPESSSSTSEPKPSAPPAPRTRDDIIANMQFHRNYYASIDTTGKIEIVDKVDSALGDITQVRNFISPAVKTQIQSEIDAEIERTYDPNLAVIFGPKPKIEAPSVAVYDFAKKSGALVQLVYLTADGSLLFKSTIDSMILVPELKESDITDYPEDTKDWTIIQATDG